jgi:hypothetical protein
MDWSDESAPLLLSIDADAVGVSGFTASEKKRWRRGPGNFSIGATVANLMGLEKVINRLFG